MADRLKGRVRERVRLQVFARDGYRCRHCGERGVATKVEAAEGDRLLVLDHIVELAEGGSEEQSNLWTLCAPCHQVKTDSYNSARQRGEDRGGGVVKRKSRSLAGGKFYKVRDVVYRRDNYTCQLCGRAGKVQAEGIEGEVVLQLDHIVEVADGGSDEYYNLRALCRECHKRKTRAASAARARRKRGDYGVDEEGWPLDEDGKRRSL